MDQNNHEELSSDKNLYLLKKKRSPTKVVKNEKEELRTSIQRGKLPTNWNSFIEHQGGNNGAKPKKYSKQVTRIFTSSKHSNQENKADEIQTHASTKPNSRRCIAIDCEMVGVGDGKENMLARVSLVDENLESLYDTFVQPQQTVVDYRTPVSGVRPVDMTDGKEFSLVQVEVSNLLRGKVLIGHAVKNDLKVLHLSHPKYAIRDTSRFKLFREQVDGRTPSLKLLALNLLGVQIQEGEHSSVEDARAAMRLYLQYRNSWESELRYKWRRNEQIS